MFHLSPLCSRAITSVLLHLPAARQDADRPENTEQLDTGACFTTFHAAVGAPIK